MPATRTSPPVRRRPWFLAVAAVLCLGAALAEPAAAQTFIKGTVLDFNNQPVAGVNINATFAGSGKDANLANDGTDANGNFLTEFLDGPDFYDITFLAPQGVALVPVTLFNIFVIGTVDLGTIVMPEGRFLAGRVLSPSRVPLPGVTVDLEDTATGQIMASLSTIGTGQFNGIVPPGVYDVLIDPDAYPYAPDQRLGVDVNAGNVNLGDLVLQPGFLLSATILSTGGGPVANVDVDIVDVATGEVLYTPGDNSDATGYVDVMVRAGTFDVEIEPRIQDRFVAVVVPALSVSTNLNLGTITVEPGWQLSGTVRDALGNPVFDVDVDAFDPGTGAEIHLPGSHTDSAGNYLVVIPVGTSLVDYVPAVTDPLRAKQITTTVNADKVQDVLLDDCPAPVHYGSGAPGAGGCTPQLDSVGDPTRLGASGFSLQLSQGVGGGGAFLWIGVQKLNVQGKGWTLLVNPLIRVRLKLSGAPGVPCIGQVTITGPLPADPALDGLHLYCQGLVLDAASAGGIAASDGLDLELCR